MRRRILHISDLHFGRDRPELLEPMIETVNGLAPDLVVMSGDFTQRARHSQFRAARAFLDRLTPPVLAVPGNHDTPLDNLAVRVVTPWARYRRYIDRDLEPSYDDEADSVVGVNTVNHLAWQRGKIGRHTVARVCKAFKGHKGRRMHVVALHHPLEHLPEVEKRLMRGARGALARLDACGADMVLSGHLHTWRAVPFETQSGILLVQAGTGLSTRVRGEPNDMNLIAVEGRRAEIERLVAEAPGTRFESADRATFVKDESGWRQLS